MDQILGSPRLPHIRDGSRAVTAQSWDTIHGAMVRDSAADDEPWFKVFVGHGAVGSIMGWPREVLPVFQQPLCSLLVLAVASLLDVGELWLLD